MKTVGIKDLKNNLSRYLRAVRAGDTVRVTDRHTVIAEIHKPTRAKPGTLSRWEAWLQAHSGRIRRPQPGGPSLRDAWRLPAPARALDLSELLEQSREDRL